MTYRGEWFHPKYPQVRVPGVLKVDDGVNRLTLYGETDFRGKPILNDNDQIHEYTILLGEDGGKKLTLLSSRLETADKINRSLDTFTVTPQIVLLGIHAKSFDELTLKELGCSFSFLSSWIDGQDSMHFIKDHESIVDWKKRVQKNIVLQINETLTIEISRVALDSIKANDSSFVISHFVDFRSTVSLPFAQFIELAQIFRKLVAFAVQYPVGFYYHNMHMGNETAKHVLIFENGKKKKGYKEPGAFHNHQNMLFDAHSLGTQNFEKVVRNWFLTFERYGVIYDMYLDTQQWFTGSGVFLSTVIYNNRLLNLIQSLESFYQIEHAEEERESKEEFENERNRILQNLATTDKKWFRKHVIRRSVSLQQMLTSLLCEFEYLFGVLFNTKAKRHEFSERIAEIRNSLSHGRHKKTDNIDEFRNDYYFCKVLLTAAILSKLGFNKAEIQKVFGLYFDLARELRFIIKSTA